MSFAPIKSYDLLLTDADIEFQINDNISPALSIPDIGFKSFNKWQCFDASDVMIDLTEVDYNGIHSVPMIKIKNMNFDIDPEIKWDIDKVLSDWNNLFNGASSVCIFGAYLQDLNDEETMWYIESIKTDNGYWHRSE